MQVVYLGHIQHTLNCGRKPAPLHDVGIEHHSTVAKRSHRKKPREQHLGNFVHLKTRLGGILTHKNCMPGSVRRCSAQVLKVEEQHSLAWIGIAQAHAARETRWSGGDHPYRSVSRKLSIRQREIRFKGCGW